MWTYFLSHVTCQPISIVVLVKIILISHSGFAGTSLILMQFPLFHVPVVSWALGFGKFVPGNLFKDSSSIIWLDPAPQKNKHDKLTRESSTSLGYGSRKICARDPSRDWSPTIWPDPAPRKWNKGNWPGNLGLMWAMGLGNFVPGIVQTLMFHYLAGSGSRKVDRGKKES